MAAKNKLSGNDKQSIQLDVAIRILEKRKKIPHRTNQ